MKLVKKSFVVLSLILGVVLMPTQAETIDDIVKRGEMRVGLSSFVPWAFLNKKGELIGFEIDVAKELAKDLGVKVKLINTAWDGIIPALQAGKFDVIISGMSVKTKRNLAINFTEGYDGIDYIMLAQLKHKDKKFVDFNSRKLKFAARRGTIPADLTKQYFPKARLLQFDDDGTALQELLSGKVDAIIETASYASVVLDENKNRVVYIDDGKAVFQAPSAFAVRKGQHDTLNVFNNWIRSKKNDGWLQERSKYWFKTRDWKDQLPQ